VQQVAGVQVERRAKGQRVLAAASGRGRGLEGLDVDPERASGAQRDDLVA